MPNIQELLQENKYKVQKPHKNAERNYYIDRLSDITGYSKRGIVFSFLGLPDNRLRDAITHCEPYTDVKTRTWKLKEFIKEIKNQ